MKTKWFIMFTNGSYTKDSGTLEEIVFRYGEEYIQSIQREPV